MKTILVFLLLSSTALAQNLDGGSGILDPDPRMLSGDISWHFLSQTYGGTISLVKNLTKKECDFLYNRAMHLPAMDDEREAAKRLEDERHRLEEKVASGVCSGDKEEKLKCNAYALMQATSTYIITSSDIKTAECFQ